MENGMNADPGTERIVKPLSFSSFYDLVDCEIRAIGVLPVKKGCGDPGLRCYLHRNQGMIICGHCLHISS